MDGKGSRKKNMKRQNEFVTNLAISGCFCITTTLLRLQITLDMAIKHPDSPQMGMATKSHSPWPDANGEDDFCLGNGKYIQR